LAIDSGKWRDENEKLNSISIPENRKTEKRKNPEPGTRNFNSYNGNKMLILRRNLSGQ
jgi:hypothetical protein